MDPRVFGSVCPNFGLLLGCVLCIFNILCASECVNWCRGVSSLMLSIGSPAPLRRGGQLKMACRAKVSRMGGGGWERTGLPLSSHLGEEARHRSSLLLGGPAAFSHKSPPPLRLPSRIYH